MPIILGAQASNARWNKRLVVVLLILQFIIAVLLELAAWVTVVFDSWAGRDRSTTTLFFLANLLLLGCVGYELFHVSDLDHLSARRFYRFQLVKTGYFGLFVLIAFILWLQHPSFDLGPLAELLMGLALTAAPYWSALWYAITVRRNAAIEFGDEDASKMPWW